MTRTTGLALVLLVACDADTPAPRAAETPTPRTDRHGHPLDEPEGPPHDLVGDPNDPLGAIDCTEKVDTGYVKGNPFPITVVTVDGKPVEKSTANVFAQMQADAAADGVNIKVVSGFRTYAEQEYLYGCYVNCNCNNCNLAAKPGYSNHQSGHALDLNTSQAGVYSWLAALAASYGFEETVQGEPWHWEWWGGGPAGGPCASCERHCEGTKIVNEACEVGDCAAFGANCVDDELGVRCVFFACPPTGMSKVCVDDKTIGDCNDGQISTGDCSQFAAFCSTKIGDQARCVSVFCATPEEEHPVPKDGCFLDGQPYHCDELGQITFSPCPEGQACTVYPTVHCEAGLGCPESGEASVCLDATAIGHCVDGAVVEAEDCGDFAGYCSTAGGVAPHCVASFCVASPDEVPEAHSICLPDGNLGLCLADGSLKTSECPAGTHCIEFDAGAACVEDTGASTGGTGGTGPVDPSASSGDAPTGDTGDPAPTTSAGATTNAATGNASDSFGQDDTGGCACDAPQTAPHGLLLVLAGLTLRRRRR